MRSALRRERHRRLRNTHCTHQYHHCAPQVFDRLEYLTQKLNYSLPGDTISQAIITTDYYLAYTLNRYLFSGTRTAVFQNFESALASLQDPECRQLVVDMDGLQLSYFETLEWLRLLVKQRNDIQIFLLLSRNDEALSKFIAMTGPFYVLPRRQQLAGIRDALLSPNLNNIHSERLSQADWEMVSLLLHGESLKKIAHSQNLPYHRIIYRLNQLITHLGLPHRQRFLHLIHRLNVTSPHLI
ncbi:MAG: fimbriae Y protein [Citrobacter sp.]|uniref:Fimbriae Y protein n=1 Tax=Citrobacter tructae TaxID=2562449 RepID=A0ABX5T9V5_9ENTR|nr:fimbriae Y protein [Citrobacter tructae]QBX83272.1 fimbriae Y protein [Citrobacter tructae]